MKVIHIASFGGNFGDILNHQGFYNTMGKALHFDTVKQIELRRFYRNASEKERLFFNDEFAREINTYDLLVLGGGGFFDVKWAYSSTGTTLDFCDSFIEKIKIPVIINAMGYHEFYGETTPEIRDKFSSFIEKIIYKNWFVSFRNDGSIDRFHIRYGQKYDNSIIKVPDNGFFGIGKETINSIFFQDSRKTIGFCITNDLFTKEYNGELNTSAFNERMVDILERLSERYRIILFAHTPDDVSLIGHIFDNLPNSVKRYNFVICPFCPNGAESTREMARYYQACDIIVGMRFHSLILALQLNKPTIAMSNHAQIGGLFEELGLEDYIVRLNTTTFGDDLYIKLDGVQRDLTIKSMINTSLSCLKEQNLTYIEKVKNYLINFKFLEL